MLTGPYPHFLKDTPFDFGLSLYNLLILQMIYHEMLIRYMTQIVTVVAKPKYFPSNIVNAVKYHFSEEKKSAARLARAVKSNVNAVSF